MDLSELKGIINLMQKSDLSELEIELQDLKLRLARPSAGQPVYESLVKQQIPQVPTPVAVSEKTESKASLRKLELKYSNLRWLEPSTENHLPTTLHLWKLANM